MSNKESVSIKPGKLFVFSGPSGVGKNTILKQILKKEELNIVLSVSCTTRTQRPNEKHAKDYFFITKEEFQQKIENDEFIEYAEFFDNFYGTPKDFLLQTLSTGKNLLLEIEVIGYKQVVSKFPQLISIFILPPDLEQLKNRLLNRNSENEEDIQMRMDKSTLELEEAKFFNYQIINNNIEDTVEKITQIILEEIKK